MKKEAFIFFAFIAISSLCIGQIPATLSYQGLLTDENGAPVPDGDHSILLNFYTVAAEGTPVFQRGPVQVSTFKGLFTVIIGNGQGTNNAALPYALGDAQYWVGVVPDGQAELSPRLSLTSVPYAFRAQHANNGVPIGTIVAFASQKVPDGWLECDGTAISRATYSELFEAIGVSWGAGDASGTFNLPDFRGRFLRGWDHGQGVDPDTTERFAIHDLGAVGNKVGTYQNDAFQTHRHALTPNPHSHNIGDSSAQDGTDNNSAGDSSDSRNELWHTDATTLTIGSPTTDGTNPAPRASTETRPQNAYVMYIIKAQ